MKRFALLPVIAVALTAACQDAPTAAPARTGAVQASAVPATAHVVARASGQGTMIGSAGLRRIFEFQAFKLSDGRAVGKGILVRAPSDPDRRQELRFSIDCMVIEENMARLSGVVTDVIKTNDNVSNPIDVGEPFQFKVVDNGEGNSASPDLMTHFANAGPGLPTPPPCGLDSGWELLPIAAGNIQVRGS